MNTMTKIRTKTEVKSQAATDSVTTGSIAFMGVTSAVIGIWGVACLVGGLVGAGGPFSLIRSWFSAVIGS